MADTRTVSGSARKLDVSGLAIGSYTVTVRAENGVGPGPDSAPVAFDLHVNPPEIENTVYVPGHGLAALQAVFDGLDPGDYEVQVWAENGVGWGPGSAPEPFTIAAEADPPPGEAQEGYTLTEVKLLDAGLIAASLPSGLPSLDRSVQRLVRRTEAGVGRGRLVLDLVSAAHPLAEYLTEDRAIRLRWDRDDDVANALEDWRRYEHWRIEGTTAAEAGGGDFTATCRPIEEDLADTVAEYEREDGTVDPYVSIYDLDVSEALRAVLTQFGPAGNRQVPFIPVQTPDSITGKRVTFAAEGTSHLDLLRLLAEEAGGRLRFRHRAGNVYVSVVPLPDVEDVDGSFGSVAAEIDARHVFDLRRTRDAGELVTTLVPLGGEQGAGFTVGELEWEVLGVISPTRIVLAAPGLPHPARRGPIWADGALAGSYLELGDGTLVQVIDTALPNVVEIGPGPEGTYEFGLGDVGMHVRFVADASSKDLTRLSVPGLPATAARNERVRRYEDAAPVPNLLERNAVSADFATLTGWERIGNTIGRGSAIVTDPALVRYGGAAQRITVSTVGDGIQTGFFTLDPEEAPYASAWVALVHEAGKWLVELVDSSGQVFGSLGEEDGWIDGGEEAYALAGMEVRAGNVIGPIGGPEGTAVRKVSLRIRCIELPASGPAQLVLDAATLTQSAVEYAYRPGLGPHEVWHRAAEELARLSLAPRVEFAGQVVDPRVLGHLPDLEVEDVVALSVNGATHRLPISAIEEELSVGSRSHVKAVTIGLPEPDASTEIGAALGLDARPGSAQWTQARGLQTRPLPTRTVRNLQRIARNTDAPWTESLAAQAERIETVSNQTNQFSTLIANNAGQILLRATKDQVLASGEGTVVATTTAALDGASVVQISVDNLRTGVAAFQNLLVQNAETLELTNVIVSSTTERGTAGDPQTTIPIVSAAITAPVGSKLLLPLAEFEAKLDVRFDQILAQVQNNQVGSADYVATTATTLQGGQSYGAISAFGLTTDVSAGEQLLFLDSEGLRVRADMEDDATAVAGDTDAVLLNVVSFTPTNDVPAGTPLFLATRTLTGRIDLQAQLIELRVTEQRFRDVITGTVDQIGQLGTAVDGTGGTAVGSLPLVEAVGHDLKAGDVVRVQRADLSLVDVEVATDTAAAETAIPITPATGVFAAPAGSHVLLPASTLEGRIRVLAGQVEAVASEATQEHAVIGTVGTLMTPGGDLQTIQITGLSIPVYSGQEVIVTDVEGDRHRFTLQEDVDPDPGTQTVDVVAYEVSADVTAGSPVLAPPTTTTGSLQVGVGSVRLAAESAQETGDTALSWLEIIPNEVILSTPVFRSDNYVAGVSGWALFSNGSIEMNDAVVRGTIEAVDGNVVIGDDGIVFGLPASYDPVRAITWKDSVDDTVEIGAFKSLALGRTLDLVADTLRFTDGATVIQMSIEIADGFNWIRIPNLQAFRLSHPSGGTIEVLDALSSTGNITTGDRFVFPNGSFLSIISGDLVWRDANGNSHTLATEGAIQA